jgi:hypothetical protein
VSDTTFALLAAGVAVVFVTVVLVTGRSRERNPHVDARRSRWYVRKPR